MFNHDSRVGFVEICGKLAPWMSVVIYAAPFPTIRQISKQKAVGDLPLLPYSTMLANCFLWATYGVLKFQPKVWSSAVVGILLSMHYFSEFMKYSPIESSTLPGSIRQHQQAVVSTVSFISVLAVTGMQDAADLIGYIAVLFCICMFASPLASLKAVIDTRSAKSIPLPFTMATIMNCFTWTVVGIYDMNDINIYLPTVIGLGLGMIQIILKLYYGDGPEDVDDVDV